MEQNIITVGDRTYTFFPLQAFACVTHLTRLKNIATAGVSGVMTDVAKVLDGIDETTLDKVIFPILKDSGLVCTTAGSKLTNATEMNALFNPENLDEFFVVVGQVLRYNFEPLLKKTLARFGIDLAQISAKAKERAQQEAQKALQ